MRRASPSRTIHDVTTAYAKLIAASPSEETGRHICFHAQISRYASIPATSVRQSFVVAAAALDGRKRRVEWNPDGDVEREKEGPSRLVGDVRVEGLDGDE